MKFGVREICDVVLKAKANQKVGNKIFYKGEPVIYFDTLKTSSMEGAATTVYAQGGRGNSRLIAWEGERTVTFTMEDALISPEGFMILSGAGLIEAGTGETIKVHATETTDKVTADGKGVVKIILEEKPYAPDGDCSNIYVMIKDGDEIITEPYIPASVAQEDGEWVLTLKSEDNLNYTVEDDGTVTGYKGYHFETGKTVVLVDYYVEKESGAKQIDITPDQFGGNYYLEAATLFRDTNGVDMPAEFIIPNCKIQSNFTFTMASSGDPSTFTFTMDAFPDYTRFNKTKKVLASIQIIDAGAANEVVRESTKSTHTVDSNGVIVDDTPNA